MLSLTYGHVLGTFLPLGAPSTPAIAMATRWVQVWPDSPNLHLLSPSISLSALGLLSWNSSQGLPGRTCTVILIHVSAWKCQLERVQGSLPAFRKPLTSKEQELVNKYSPLPSLGWTNESHILHCLFREIEPYVPKAVTFWSTPPWIGFPGLPILFFLVNLWLLSFGITSENKLRTCLQALVQALL